jgi:hypothetical protein
MVARAPATDAIGGDPIMKQAYQLHDHFYDVLIVGAGGAGLRAALGMAASGLRTPITIRPWVKRELSSTNLWCTRRDRRHGMRS